MNKIKNFMSLMWNALGIRTISAIFTNDAHSIISKKGLNILEEKQKTVYIDEYEKV
ncbi:MAG: hypothetical protein SLAVMIC_00697 [uncultured marine phage]|uniref:Uncharacterized protein n=1 Tax=uncultured marine phage TaxID=707152 RepID=A0A8D9CDH2_9VIRU|nr:MAG: hypothetical protein SLAVMIC_00697 [uncultured marine phage]